MKTVAIVLLSVSLAMSVHAADRAIDEAYTVCGEHRAAPLPGQLGPPKGFATGWERCVDVERLYLEQHSADQDQKMKDSLDALVNSRGGPK